MRLVKPSYEILKQEPGLEGIYKMIELAGRTCYKSEDKITEDSARKFVDMLIARGHTAMLEHGTVYLKIPCTTNHSGFSEIHYIDEPYSKIKLSEGLVFKDEYNDPCDCWCVTTNYRVLLENNWLDDLKYLCEPTEHHEKRVTVKFTSNIHFYKDITRHRKMSFAIESTRYCNYSKGKFSNELTFLIPQWIDLEEGRYGIGHDFINGWFIHHLDNDIRILPKTKEEHGVFNFMRGLKSDEHRYLKAIELEWRPEQAAELLPQATKADIVMTGFVSDWNYIFSIRVDGKTGVPHPEVKRLMEPVKEEFIKRGYINGN